MRIGVIGSMQHTEKLLDLCNKLNELGHTAFCSSLTAPLVGKTDDEKETIKLDQKYHQDAIRSFWRQMQGADAVLMANYDKHGQKNYVGGNAFLELGFAHVLDQKIFFLNDIPENPYYQTEIIAMKPVILHGDLRKII